MVATPKTRPKRNPSEASASASSSSVCLVAATAAAPRSSHFWLMAWGPGQAHGQQLRWAQVSWSRSMGGHGRSWQIHLPNERAGPVDIYDEPGVDTASRLDLTWLGLSEAETETGPRSTGRGEEQGTGTAQHCQGINFLLASLLFLYLASHLTWDLSSSAVWPPSKMICCVIYGNATSQFLYSFLSSFFLQSPVCYYGSQRNLWTTHPFCRSLFTSAAASGCDFGQQRLAPSTSPPPLLSISLTHFEVDAARASHAKLKFGREACWHLSHKGWLATVFSLLFSTSSAT